MPSRCQTLISSRRPGRCARNMPSPTPPSSGSMASSPNRLRKNTISKVWRSAEATRIMAFWTATQIAPKAISRAASTIGGKARRLARGARMPAQAPGRAGGVITGSRAQEIAQHGDEMAAAGDRELAGRVGAHHSEAGRDQERQQEEQAEEVPRERDLERVQVGRADLDGAGRARDVDVGGQHEQRCPNRR